MAVRANVNMINFERLIIFCFWFQIKIEQKQDAVQLFSIKAYGLSVKSAFKLHFQNVGIENLAYIEVLSIDDCCGAPADGGAIGGVDGGMLA